MEKGKKSTYFFHKCNEIAKIKMESKTSVSSELYLVIYTWLLRAILYVRF